MMSWFKTRTLVSGHRWWRTLSPFVPHAASPFIRRTTTQRVLPNCLTIYFQNCLISSSRVVSPFLSRVVSPCLSWVISPWISRVVSPCLGRVVSPCVPRGGARRTWRWPLFRPARWCCLEASGTLAPDQQLQKQTETQWVIPRQIDQIWVFLAPIRFDSAQIQHKCCTIQDNLTHPLSAPSDFWGRK